MTIHTDKTFKDEALILEECIFIRCELNDCHLFYSGGEFNFIDSKITNCQFHFRGPAINTVNLLRFTGTIPPDKPKVVEPPPLVN